MPNNRRSSAALRHGLRGGLFIAALCGLLGLSSHPAALASPMPVSAKPLQIYFVDVEGGQATLFVTPQGKSLLIDTGWPGFNGRDADRIAAVAKLAGITKIDFVLLTHYHQDHAGGVTQLAAKIPVGTFLDHGENREPADSATGQHNEGKVLSVLSRGQEVEILSVQYPSRPWGAAAWAKVKR